MSSAADPRAEFDLLDPIAGVNELRARASRLGERLHPVGEVDAVASCIAASAWQAVCDVPTLSAANGTDQSARRALAAVLRRAAGHRPPITEDPIFALASSVCTDQWFVWAEDYRRWAHALLADDQASSALLAAACDLAAADQGSPLSVFASVLAFTATCPD